MVLVLAAPLALAGSQEEVETHFVAPYTTGKMVTVMMAGGKKVEGKVVSGDDDQITVQQSSGPVNVPAENIRGDNTPGKVGPIVGGVVLGFADSYVGRYLVRHMAAKQVTLKGVQEGSSQKPQALMREPESAESSVESAETGRSARCVVMVEDGAEPESAISLRASGIAARICLRGRPC